MNAEILFEIHSHRGVGPIQFGMTPNEARLVLGTQFESFKRNVQDPYPCDYFTNLQCFVYYDINQRVDSVEFAEPAEPTLNGKNLLGLGFTELIKMIAAIDPEVSIENDGFTSKNLGVGGWAPCSEVEPDSLFESIIIFCRGYYD